MGISKAIPATEVWFHLHLLDAFIQLDSQLMFHSLELFFARVLPLHLVGNRTELQLKSLHCVGAWPAQELVERKRTDLFWRLFESVLRNLWKRHLHHLLVGPLHAVLWEQPHHLDGLFRKFRHIHNLLGGSLLHSFTRC